MATEHILRGPVGARSSLASNRRTRALRSVADALAGLVRPVGRKR